MASGVKHRIVYGRLWDVLPLAPEWVRALREQKGFSLPQAAFWIYRYCVQLGAGDPAFSDERKCLAALKGGEEV